MEFTKKEIAHLSIATIVAGIVFFLNEWRTTDHNISTGLTSFIGFILICAFIYAIHTLSQKLMAKKSSCEVEFTTISTNFKKLPLYLKPIGPVITLLISILSSGKLFFIALASFNLKVKRRSRIGHKWTNLKDFEEACIAFAGPLSNLILLVIFKLLLFLSPSFFSKAIFISSSLAIFHLLPFPKFDGLKIFFGSRFLYLFAIVLTVLLVFLVNFVNALIALIIALIIAIGFTFLFFYQSIKKKL